MEKVKRLQVTLEINVPSRWTIGETDRWLADTLSYGAATFSPRPVIGEQRMAPKKVVQDAAFDGLARRGARIRAKDRLATERYAAALDEDDDG